MSRFKSFKDNTEVVSNWENLTIEMSALKVEISSDLMDGKRQRINFKEVYEENYQ